MLTAKRQGAAPAQNEFLERASPPLKYKKCLKFRGRPPAGLRPTWAEGSAPGGSEGAVEPWLVAHCLAVLSEVQGLADTLILNHPVV